MGTSRSVPCRPTGTSATAGCRGCPPCIHYLARRHHGDGRYRLFRPCKGLAASPVPALAHVRLCRPLYGRCHRLFGASALFAAMFRLHRWLLDSRPSGDGIFWGKLVVGVSTLLFVFVLLSGIVIWWPRTRKTLRNSLQIHFRKGWRLFWYGLHVAGGMYAFLLLLVMALTGLTWSFNWYRTGFYRLFGVEAQSSGMGHGNAAAGQKKGPKDSHGQKFSYGKNKGDKTAHWQEVYDCLRAENPSATQITLADGTASIPANRFGNIRAIDRYTFDSCTGELTGRTLYRDLDNSSKIRGWIYSVHVGSWGGVLTRFLWFLAALLGATLPLTGYYLWLKRICRKKP